MKWINNHNFFAKETLKNLMTKNKTFKKKDY